MAERGLKFLFQPGEHVLCFEPDPAKARVLYGAKVLETSVVRDRKGRKKTGYQIHFQGWNSSWDRVVPENFILKNSVENCQLMKRLVHTARHIRKNKARRRRIDEILRIHFNNSLRFDDDDKDASRSLSPDSDDLEDDSEEVDTRWQDGSDEATEDYDCDDTTGREDEATDDEETVATADATVSLPDNLRKQLEEDWMSIKQRDKVVSLPASLSVIHILEGYVKNIAVNSLCATARKPQRHAVTPGGKDEHDTSNHIELCKEMVDGLRTAFDFCLPTILLYDSERAQFEAETQAASCRNTMRHNMSTPTSAAHGGDSSRPARHRNLSGGHASTCGAILGEPPTKILHVKQEMIEDDDETPPRRITRHLYAVEARKTKLSRKSSSGGDNKKSCAFVNKSIVEESSEVETEEETPILRRNSLRSRTRHGSDTKTPGDCVIPLAPSTVPSTNHPAVATEPRAHVSFDDEFDSKKQPNVDQPTTPQHAALVSDVLSWRLVPPEVYATIPPPPSTIYGAQHLLRLFVKLPDLLQQMALPRMHLQHLTQHVETFLMYLSERIDELFPESAYIDRQDFSVHDAIKAQSTKHLGRTI